VFAGGEVANWKKMKKGVHPWKQWISYVTQTGRLIDILEIVVQSHFFNL